MEDATCEEFQLHGGNHALYNYQRQAILLFNPDNPAACNPTAVDLGQWCQMQKEE